MKIIYSGITDVGLKRKVNQDAIFMHTCDERNISLMAVCDGMGGHENGEIASGIMKTHLGAWVQSWATEYYDEEFSEMLETLEDEVRKANKEIYSRYSLKAICGTTCTILLIYGNRYGIINAGDSRIYKNNGFKCKLLTEDDTWENQRKVNESLSKREIRKHPNFGKLINAVGTYKNMKLNVNTDSVAEGDAFLLCSDGLYKYCQERFISKILRSLTKDNLEASVGRLIEKVYDKGAGDNVSVILVKCVN